MKDIVIQDSMVEQNQFEKNCTDCFDRSEVGTMLEIVVKIT